MEYRLTQFSPGAGCGCKIAPKDLEAILHSEVPHCTISALLVGNESKDDAAVYDLGNGTSVISTTDFFTPIVDDPYDFGRIASVNAISDVYSMGGKPLMAIAILGWPLDKLPSDIAALVIEGARSVCDKAGIPLAGGHSISISDPIFGLAVTGTIANNRIKQNNTAVAGCSLFLTKPIGIGIVTTAEKRGLVNESQKQEALHWMTTLNTAGEAFATLPGVTAMTDVTGFGLLGHLLEMAEGSSLKATIRFDAVPKIDGIENLIAQQCTPGGTKRNWNSYGSKVGAITELQRAVLCDPQTSGGLLVAVEPNSIETFKELAHSINTPITEIGQLSEYTEGVFVEVK